VRNHQLSLVGAAATTCKTGLASAHDMTTTLTNQNAGN